MQDTKQPGHCTPNGGKILRHGHDPSQNLIKICQVVTIQYIGCDKPENSSIISCTG